MKGLIFNNKTSIYLTFILSWMMILAYPFISWAMMNNGWKADWSDNSRIDPVSHYGISWTVSMLFYSISVLLGVIASLHLYFNKGFGYDLQTNERTTSYLWKSTNLRRF